MKARGSFLNALYRMEGGLDGLVEIQGEAKHLVGTQASELSEINDRMRQLCRAIRGEERQ